MPQPKRTKKSSKKILPLFAFAFSLILIFVGLALRYHADPIFPDYQPEELISQESVRPILISFPSRSFSLSVLPASIVDSNWEINQDAANFLITSSPPQSGGNTIIYGHNTSNVFALLRQVTLGEKIVLKTNSGLEYSYTVSEVLTVNPSQVEVLAPTDYEILTLYTCTGLLDQKRLIIKAQPAN